MNSRTEAFLAEAKRLTLSPDERAAVRQVLTAHQAATATLTLDPAEKAVFRRRLKESMGTKADPWWQVLLQLPQLSLPVAGLAVFLLVFASGGITSLRWLTDDSTPQTPIAPAGLDVPDAQNMVPDGLLQMPDRKSDGALPQQPPLPAADLPKAPEPQEPAANEPAAESAPVEHMMLYQGEGEETQPVEALPAMDTLDAAGQAMPAEPMMMKAMPMMQNMELQADEPQPAMMRMMKGGCGALLPAVTDSGSSLTDSVAPLLQPEEASGALLP